MTTPPDVQQLHANAVDAFPALMSTAIAVLEAEHENHDDWSANPDCKQILSDSGQVYEITLQKQLPDGMTARKKFVAICRPDGTVPNISVNFTTVSPTTPAVADEQP